jgi:hypothetical protein
MSISARAMGNVQAPGGLVKPMPTNVPDRDVLREKWRLAAIAFAEAEDKAIRAREGRQIFLDALIDALLEQSERLSQTKAERMARTSQAYADYMQKMHDLRHTARLAEIEEKNADRLYWEQVSQEARERQELRMTR